MTCCRSDQFKSLYKLVQAFEFIRSEKGHKLNILKHDLLQRIHIENIKIVKNEDTTTDATRRDTTRHDATRRDRRDDYFDYFVKGLP